MVKQGNYLLCLDCATQIYGWAIINKDDLSLVDYGQIKKTDGDIVERICYISDSISKIIEKYQDYITEAVIEEVPPSSQNSLTVLQLGRINGATILLLHQHNIPIAPLIDVSHWHSELEFTKAKGDIKKQSINWANKKYNLNLKYVAPKSKLNEDNMSDPICFGCVYLNNYDKRGFGKRGSKA